MRRATTPTHIFTFPDSINVANVESVLITYSQSGKNILEKNIDDTTIDTENNTFTLELSQAESDLFAPGKALVQVRATTNNQSAVVSQMIWITVKPALNSEVM